MASSAWVLPLDILIRINANLLILLLFYNDSMKNFLNCNDVSVAKVRRISMPYIISSTAPIVCNTQHPLDFASTITPLPRHPAHPYQVNMELLGDKYVKAVTESMMPTGVITEEYLDGLDRLRLRLGRRHRQHQMRSFCRQIAVTLHQTTM